MGERAISTTPAGSRITATLGEFRVEPSIATRALQLFSVLDQHGEVVAEFESNLDAFTFASRRNAELMRTRANGGFHG